MNMARISESGQITIPIEIREKLGLKDGDKIVFLEQDEHIFIANSNRISLEKLQEGMKGEAEKTGLTSETEVIDYCREIRKELWDERYADND